MKRMILLLALTCASAFGQLFGPPLTDNPQHGFAAGIGVGPSTKDFSALVGFAERVSMSGTYSYSGASFLPQLIKQPNGSKVLAVTPIVHSGVKQVIYQQNRLTIAVDASAGASLPSSAVDAFNFSAVGGVDFVWRLKRDLNSSPGGSNNYVALSAQFTQLTGTPGGTNVSLAISFVHGVNGQ